MEVFMKKRISKMEFPVLVVIFVMTISFSSLFKDSINHVDALTLAKDISGVGTIKSNKIIQEREQNGHYKDEKDFYHRTKKFGIGEVVYNRINKKYKY